MRKERSSEQKQLLELIRHKFKGETPQVKLPLLEGNYTKEMVKEKRKMSDQLHSKGITERVKHYHMFDGKSKAVSHNKGEMEEEGGLKYQLRLEELRKSGSKGKLR